MGVSGSVLLILRRFQLQILSSVGNYSKGASFVDESSDISQWDSAPTAAAPTQTLTTKLAVQPEARDGRKQLFVTFYYFGVRGGGSLHGQRHSAQCGCSDPHRELSRHGEKRVRQRPPTGVTGHQAPASSVRQTLPVQTRGASSSRSILPREKKHVL